MKSIPQISKYMTTNPITIGADMTLEKASTVMAQNRIRHLPVLEGGQLIGILSDRDVNMAESFKDVDPTKTRVKEVCIESPFKVSPKAPLDEVCSEMASHRYGSVLIVDNQKLVGIFTWIDALQSMNELLGQRFKSA